MHCHLPIQDGAHEGFGPLTESESVAKPVIEVDQTLVAGPCFVGVDNYTLFSSHLH